MKKRLRLNIISYELDTRKPLISLGLAKFWDFWEGLKYLSVKMVMSSKRIVVLDPGHPSLRKNREKMAEGVSLGIQRVFGNWGK